MKTFIVSRTDAIGDLVLTLPVCSWLKERYPTCRVVLLGRDYTRAIGAACPAVDAFLSDDELRALPEPAQVALLRAYDAEAVIHVFPNKRLARLCRLAGVQVRIGTRNRWFHWLTCNRLVSLSRRHSPLHEAQLNMELLRPLGLTTVPSLDELALSGRLLVSPANALPAAIADLLVHRNAAYLNVVLHPGSRGSGRDWPLEYYGQLARLLHTQGHRVFVTGTAAEGKKLLPWLQEHAAYCCNLTGQLNLPQLINFISQIDGVVAASTGPVHVAAALGRHALGLYVPMRPMHPGRWAPLGPRAGYLVFDKPDCQACRAEPILCSCIKALVPEQVLTKINAWHPLPRP